MSDEFCNVLIINVLYNSKCRFQPFNIWKFIRGIRKEAPQYFGYFLVKKAIKRGLIT
jgi:hypothetical protein